MEGDTPEKSAEGPAGDYYVIFDNRRGKELQKVRLLIRAVAPKLPDARPSSPDKDRSKEKQI